MADELADLRKANAILHGVITNREIEIGYREAEISKLRAGLRKIADLVGSDGDEPLDEAISIAIKTLGE